MHLMAISRHPIDHFLAWKENFRKRSPIEKWQFVQSIARVLFGWVGWYILEETHRLELLTVVPGIAIVDYFVCLIYTFWAYRNDVMRAIQPLCVIGIALPSAMTYLLIVVRKWSDAYRSLIFFGGHYIYPLPTDASEKFRDAYNEAAIMLNRTTLTIFAAITLSTLTYTIYPLYTYIFENAHPMPLPVILPFINPDTNFGYYLNVVNQLFMTYVAIFANIAIEYVNMTLVNNMWVGVSSVQCALDEFGHFIKSEPHKLLEMKQRLRAILMRIRDLDRYIERLAKFYYWKFLLQPLLIAFSVAMSIFCQMMAGWTSGYGSALCEYTQLIILCYMGNIVAIANLKLSKELWSAPWYLMPPIYQKMFQIILIRIDNGARLTIGPFAELNFETATNLTKIIYRFLMVLIRIAE